MIITMAEVTPPDASLRLPMLDLLWLMAQHNHQFTTGSGTMGKWTLDAVRFNKLTPLSKVSIKPSINQLLEEYPALGANGYKTHVAANEKAYLDAYELLTTTEGKVTHLYTWMSVEEPVTSPLLSLARVYGTKCFNLAAPSTRHKIEDWVMLKTLSF